MMCLKLSLSGKFLFNFSSISIASSGRLLIIKALAYWSKAIGFPGCIFIDNCDNILKVLDNYSKNLDEIKNAIKNKDSKKLLEIFALTKKVRKEIIEAGQDTEKPDFGRK